jgi:hypothetical protein
MKFINKIQHYLLLHHPLIWSTRIIPTLIFSGMVSVLLFIFFYFTTTTTGSASYSFPAWVSFLGLSSVIAIIVYLIYLLRFNQFKNFGSLHWHQFFMHFIILFTALGSMIIWPFIPGLAAHVATNTTHTIPEMEADMEEAYILAIQLEYTKETVPYRMVNIQVNDSVSDVTTDDVNNNIIVPSEKDIQRERYVKLEKKSETQYVGYEQINLLCAEFPYGLGDYDGLNRKLYQSVQADISDRETKLAKLNEIFAKYIRYYDGNVRKGSIDIYGYDNTESGICTNYRLSEMGGAMQNISDRIFRSSDWAIYLRFWFYLTLYSTLLLLIFRYMSPRTFLWTLLFTFLLFVFTMIVTLSSGLGEISIFSVMVFYYLVFLGFAITIFFSKSRNVFQGIALNLSFFFLPILPLVLSLMACEINQDGRNCDVVIQIAEFVGVFLLLISSLVFHSRLFYKWYSLPE